MGRKKHRVLDSEEEPQAPAESPRAGEGEPQEPLTLEQQVEQLSSRCQDLNERWLRAQANYQNLRRRAQQDLEASLQRSMQPLLEELLFVLDFLDMALATPATNEETRNLVLGVQMTRTKFVQALENSDVREIPAEGTFDPALHEASEAREVEGAAPGRIVETVRKGYTWQGRVLRHAQVVVARGSDEGAPEAPESPAEPGPADAPPTEDPA